MLCRQARAAQIFYPRTVSPRDCSQGHFNSPHRAGTTVVSSERSSDVDSSRTRTVHTSVGMVDLHHYQFSLDQFQRGIGRSGRSSDDWVGRRCAQQYGFQSLDQGTTTTLEFGRQTIPAREQTNEILTGSARGPGKITTKPHHSQFGFLRRRGFGGVIRRASPNVEELPALFQRVAAQQFQVALEERHRAEGEGDELAEEHAWKLFALVPRMLMHRVHGTGECGPRRFRHERRTLRQGQVARIVGVSQDVHSHWSTEEAVCKERGGGTKRHGSPGARAEGPGPPETGRNWSVRLWLPKNEESSEKDVHKWRPVRHHERCWISPYKRHWS